MKRAVSILGRRTVDHRTCLPRLRRKAPFARDDRGSRGGAEDSLSPWHSDGMPPFSACPISAQFPGPVRFTARLRRRQRWTEVPHRFGRCPTSPIAPAGRDPGSGRAAQTRPRFCRSSNREGARRCGDFHHPPTELESSVMATKIFSACATRQSGQTWGNAGVREYPLRSVRPLVAAILLFALPRPAWPRQCALDRRHRTPHP